MINETISLTIVYVLVCCIKVSEFVVCSQGEKRSRSPPRVAEALAEVQATRSIFNEENMPENLNKCDILEHKWY